jgi:hypothetical protein
MAYPALIAARRLAPAAGVARRVAIPVIGGVTLAAWDLYLDPQMVAAGHWRWTYQDPHLPGVHAVPLTTLAGWLVVCAVIALVAQGILGDRPVGEAQMLDELNLASPYPRLVACTPAERLVQPLLAWSWLTFLLLRLAESSPRPLLSAAGGQFRAVRREVYERAGGHSRMSSTTLPWYAQ